jgi:branched-chain amino acid transport system permease protein
MVLQIIVNGIVAGALYILSGLSFGLIYTSTGVFHFANVAAYTIGGFALYQIFVVWGFPFLIALAFSLLIASALGVLIEWICYKPLREQQASSLQIFLTSIGATFVLQNVYLLIWRSDPRVVPVYETLLGGRQVGPVRVTYLQVITVAVVAILWGALHLFMKKTRTGKAIRAFAADPDVAELMGIDTRWLRVAVFAIGSALIAAVAELQIMDLGIDMTSGFDVVIIGTIAALLGGRWGITGIALVSLSIGLIENAGMILLAVQWKYIILFGLVIVLLYLRPKAIFGAKSR